MLNRAWDDAYHELWEHAAHHRGLRAATGELPGHALSPSLRRWPRTCDADVVAIAAVIHPALCNAPLETGGHGVVACSATRAGGAHRAALVVSEPAEGRTQKALNAEGTD